MNSVANAAVRRSKLYEQVWSIPGWRLAVMYGISDVGLAKVCKRYNVPRPPRGYWARIEAGQKVRQIPLPNRDDDEIVHFGGWAVPEQAIAAMNEFNRSGVALDKLGQIHHVATCTREALAQIAPDSEGLVKASPPAFDIRVSPKVADRAVALINTLAWQWESCGGSITLLPGREESIGIQFVVGQDSFGIRLVENIDESKPLTDSMRLTGNLALHIVGDEQQQFRRRWSDTKSQRLEKMLGSFVQTLIAAINAKRQDRLNDECVMRQRERVRQRREASSRDASREFYWRQELTQLVDRWHESQRIKTFLATLQAAIETGRWKPASMERFTEWVDWAGQFANAIDPISGGRLPEALSIEHKNTIVGDIDITSSCRTVVSAMGIGDTDALSQQTQDAVRQACAGAKFGPVWNEITRVLEALGYDVSKREQMSEWY